jgi:cyclophilin family peptidyl-prolyl cis-trans isomerase
MVGWRVWVVLLAVVVGCGRSQSNGVSTRVSRSDGATLDATRRPRVEAPPDALNGALRLAFPTEPFDPGTFDRVMAQLASATEPRVRETLIIAAARRAPANALSRLWAVTSPDLASALARGLCGRSRGMAPVALPPPLIPLLGLPHPDMAAATVVSRFSLSLGDVRTVELGSLLVAGSLEDQLSGARLIAAPGAAVPDLGLIAAMSPFGVTVLARSLGSRSDTTSALWGEILTLLANRARLAPRLWGNAWRALRDAAPRNRPDLAEAFATAVRLANPVSSGGLPNVVSAHLRCENAVALDRLTGSPNATLSCANGAERWIALASQAEVWGSREDLADQRVASLRGLVEESQRDSRVVEQVASAAVLLPARSASPLIRQLGRERDPGVLAALLEGLVLHVQHARSLPDAERDALLRAPFAQPEPTTIEARVHATTLARLLGRPDIVELAVNSTVRAIQHAAHPDAGIGYRSTPPAPDTTRVRWRLVLDPGTVEIDLDPHRAPLAVQQIVNATRAHRYDGLTFHRVVPAFVTQGGDPRGDGYGGTDTLVPTELSVHSFERGAIGVPLAGLDTGGIQFFITLADAPHLDGRYPNVGTVIRGMDVADSLLIGDRIQRAEIVSDP